MANTPKDPDQKAGGVKSYKAPESKFPVGRIVVLAIIAVVAVLVLLQFLR